MLFSDIRTTNNIQALGLEGKDELRVGEACAHPRLLQRELQARAVARRRGKLQFKKASASRSPNAPSSVFVSQETYLDFQLKLMDILGLETG